MDALIYILECADGTLYTGSTNNIKKRLREHNQPSSTTKYTRVRRPLRLVYTEECATLSMARTREAEIKRLSRKEKLLLVNKK